MKLNKQEMTGGTKITLIISGAAMLAGIVIVVLFAAGVLALSEQSRTCSPSRFPPRWWCFPTRCANRWGYLKIKKNDSHPHAHVGNG